MEGSILSFLKAEWKVSDTGSAHWASSISSKTFKKKTNGIVGVYRLPPFAGDGKITREERERKYGQREIGCISVDQQQFSYSEKYRWPWKGPFASLLAACVFGESFGFFADVMLGHLSWQQKTNSGLDLPRCDGRSLVLVSKSWYFCGNSFENVVDEAVHDWHGLAGNASVGMNLSQDFVYPRLTISRSVIG